MLRVNKDLNIKYCVNLIFSICIILFPISYFINNYLINYNFFRIFIINTSNPHSLLQTIWQIQAGISILVIALFTIIQSKFDEKIYGIRVVECLKKKRFHIVFKKCNRFTYWDFIILSILLIPAMYPFVAYNLLLGAIFIFFVNIFLIIKVISINIEVLINPEGMQYEMKQYLIDSKSPHLINQAIESVGYEKSYLSLENLNYIEIFNKLYQKEYESGNKYNLIPVKDFYSYYYRILFENQYLILYDKRRLIGLMVSSIFSFFQSKIKFKCLSKNNDNVENKKINIFINILSEILKETIETEDEETFKNILLETYKLKIGKYYSKEIPLNIEVIYFDSLFISIAIYLYYLIFIENSINKDLKLKYRKFFDIIYFTDENNNLKQFIQDEIEFTIWETYKLVVNRLRLWEKKENRLHHFCFMNRVINEFFVFYSIAFISKDSYSYLINDLPENVFYDFYPYFKDDSKLLPYDSNCNFLKLFKPKKPKEQQERGYKILSKLFQKQYDILLNNKIIKR